MERSKSTISLPSDTEIQVVRSFDAPRAMVFDAWANPDLVVRWYACSTQIMTVAELDFREGGKWRWQIRDRNDGRDHSLSGEYREIARPDRLVFTERYEPIPQSDHLVLLAFDEQQGITTQTMTIRHRTPQMRDGHLQSGVTTGIEETMQRLDAVLAAQRS